jgi:hypothetical protein
MCWSDHGKSDVRQQRIVDDHLRMTDRNRYGHQRLGIDGGLSSSVPLRYAGYA